MIIKASPEDFIVKEINNLDLSGGNYSYYLLKKIKLTTPAAVKMIARKLKINEKNINYAGNKDKDAITEQYISILNGPKLDERLNKKLNDDITKISGKIVGKGNDGEYELSFIGKGKERLTLGKLEGNYFEIIVRDADKYSIPPFFVNYFDDQRFGKESKNHILGKMLIKKLFGDFCRALGVEAYNNDYVGAIKKKFDKKKLLLYIHAYQSFLFNETINEYFENLERDGIVRCRKIDYCLGKLNIPINISKTNIRNLLSVNIPIVGFGTEFKERLKDKTKVDKEGYEKIENILKQLLEKEGILSLREFIIPQLNGLTVEGSFRKLVMEVKNLNVEKVGIGEGYIKKEEKTAYKCAFILPKGSYGTIVVKTIF